jgi:hypothetical protein
MKRAVLFATLVALVATALPAAASTFLAMDQRAMVRASDAVVMGEVTEVRSFWNDEATAIVTEAFVKVNETFAGNAPGVVVVRTFGGQVGAVYIEAHGFPTFHKGQNLVLFLEGAGDVARVVGYQQGQYRVVTRKSDGARVAVPTVDSGAALIHADGRPAGKPRAVELDTLRSQVHAVAREIGQNFRQTPNER